MQFTEITVGIISLYLTWLWRQSSRRFSVIWLFKNYLPKKYDVLEVTHFIWFSKFYFDSHENMRTPFSMLGVALWIEIYWRWKILNGQRNPRALNIWIQELYYIREHTLSKTFPHKAKSYSRLWSVYRNHNTGIYWNRNQSPRTFARPGPWEKNIVIQDDQVKGLHQLLKIVDHVLLNCDKDKGWNVLTIDNYSLRELFWQ